MNVLETEWWTLAVPPEWWAEAEDDGILVGDRDGVGCIEISTLQKESGAFDAETVADIAHGDAPPGAQWQPVTLGDFSGLVCAGVDDGTALREWYVACGPMLLYITYSCELENQGMDDAAVDELLDTLAVVEQA